MGISIIQAASIQELATEKIRYQGPLTRPSSSVAPSFALEAHRSQIPPSAHHNPNSPFKQLEVLLVRQMLSIMMPAEPDGLPESESGSMWHSFFIDALADRLGGSIDLGLARSMEGMLTGLTEAVPKKAKGNV